MLGEHLLGIYEKALDAEDDWYQRMEKARELGFDFLEISIDETDERLSRIYGNDREIYQIQDAARKAGVFPLAAQIRKSVKKQRTLWSVPLYLQTRSAFG